MSVEVVTRYKEADEILRQASLRQALYDEGAILMKDVLVNLFGRETPVELAFSQIQKNN